MLVCSVFLTFLCALLLVKYYVIKEWQAWRKGPVYSQEVYFTLDGSECLDLSSQEFMTLDDGHWVEDDDENDLIVGRHYEGVSQATYFDVICMLSKHEVLFLKYMVSYSNKGAAFTYRRALAYSDPDLTMNQHGIRKHTPLVDIFRPNSHTWRERVDNTFLDASPPVSSAQLDLLVSFGGPCADFHASSLIGGMKPSEVLAMIVFINSKGGKEISLPLTIHGTLYNIIINRNGVMHTQSLSRGCAREPEGCKTE